MPNDEPTNKPFSQHETDALTCMTLIYAMSIACQGVIDVKILTGQVRPVSHNMLVVAKSGQRKTPIYSVALKTMAKGGV